MNIGERLSNVVFRHPALRRTITKAAMASTRLPVVGGRLRRAYFTDNMVPRETLPRFLSAALSFSGGTSGLDRFVIDRDPQGRPIYGMQGFRSTWRPKGKYVPSGVTEGNLASFLRYMDGHVPFNDRALWLSNQGINTQVAIQQMLAAQRNI